MTRHESELSRPEFEVADPSANAIYYLEHGYPDPLVRWHFHNQYELHYIVATSGKVFIGDYIGQFHPGNLILTGPRLPHNWISSVEPDERFPLRDMVVHFEHDTIERAAGLMPEFGELLPLLDEARCGIEFFGLRASADRYMRAIRDSSGPTRMGYFCQFMHELASCPHRRILSSMPFDPKVDDAGLDHVNTVVNYLAGHYQDDITLTEIATKVGMNSTYFSRFFRKSTGQTFNEYLTKIRISKACELLSNSDRQITSICYEVGYNNVANFNRRFRNLKKVTPREYRSQARARLTREGSVAAQAS